uniref:Uncharacterized protein n=1 Tax=Arundo donax TaxID=35708 RepID=A0A0A8Y4H7_ARUDO
MRYWRAPTVLLYLKLSSAESRLPSVLVSFSEVDIGLAVGLQFSMLVFFNKSLAYFDCVSVIPLSECLTSIPKK